MKALSTKDVARLLGFRDDSRVRQLILSGELKATKIAGVWIIDESDVREFQKTWRDGRKKIA